MNDPVVSKELHGKRIAVLVANEGVEQVELISPWRALLNAGADVILVAPRPGKIQAFNHLDKGDKFDVDATSGEIAAEEFDGLILPGGVANADQLRADGAGVHLVRDFFEVRKPVAVICHGSWAIVEAGCVKGRTLTSWPTLRTDITNAGGTWVDEEVQVCSEGPNVLVSSRKPDDLPAFNATLLDVFAKTEIRTSA